MIWLVRVLLTYRKISADYNRLTVGYAQGKRTTAKFIRNNNDNILLSSKLLLKYCFTQHIENRQVQRCFFIG